jgi:hypothetical protein
MAVYSHQQATLGNQRWVDIQMPRLSGKKAGFVVTAQPHVLLAGNSLELGSLDNVRHTAVALTSVWFLPGKSCRR